jgi:hypothetical protein
MQLQYAENTGTTGVEMEYQLCSGYAETGWLVVFQMLAQVLIGFHFSSLKIGRISVP